VCKTLDLDALPFDPTWPTRRADLALALSILAEHQRVNGGPLRLLEDWGEASEEEIWVRLPPWLVELTRRLRAFHGERAKEIVGRVLNTLLPVTPLH